MDVFFLLPCFCYKTLTVILQQVCVLFHTTIASVVLYTKAVLSPRKPLQAVEPKSGNWSMQDVYNEVIHNAQYEGGAAIFR